MADVLLDGVGIDWTIGGNRTEEASVGAAL